MRIEYLIIVNDDYPYGAPDKPWTAMIYRGTTLSDDPLAVGEGRTEEAAIHDALAGSPFDREAAECLHCDRAIVYDEQDGWIDPEATGDDMTWRETCDQHDTFEARHEPA